MWDEIGDTEAPAWGKLSLYVAGLVSEASVGRQLQGVTKIGLSSFKPHWCKTTLYIPYISLVPNYFNGLL